LTLKSQVSSSPDFAKVTIVLYRLETKNLQLVELLKPTKLEDLCSFDDFEVDLLIFLENLPIKTQTLLKKYVI
jgi:hypothetical protein